MHSNRVTQRSGVGLGLGASQPCHSAHDPLYSHIYDTHRHTVSCAAAAHSTSWYEAAAITDTGHSKSRDGPSIKPAPQHMPISHEQCSNGMCHEANCEVGCVTNEPFMSLFVKLFVRPALVDPNEIRCCKIQAKQL